LYYVFSGIFPDARSLLPATPGAWRSWRAPFPKRQFSPGFVHPLQTAGYLQYIDKHLPLGFQALQTSSACERAFVRWRNWQATMFVCLLFPQLLLTLAALPTPPLARRTPTAPPADPPMRLASSPALLAVLFCPAESAHRAPGAHQVRPPDTTPPCLPRDRIRVGILPPAPSSLTPGALMMGSVLDSVLLTHFF
jgi:hypothetical protein